MCDVDRGSGDDLGDWGILTSGETLAVQNRAKKSALSMAPSMIVLLVELFRSLNQY